MSTTPRTDAARGFYDMDTAVSAEDMAKIETELVRLRADLERFTGHGLLDCHAICDQRDSAVSERDRLRAEVERLRKRNELLTDHYECKMNIQERVSNIETELAAMKARAEKAEAELAEWSRLKAWGGTPEIVHKFIKCQQNRIHYCQDLETELAKAEAESLEQARLLGISGSREAALLSEIEFLKKIVAETQQPINTNVNKHDL